jgi:hypothetical protein
MTLTTPLRTLSAFAKARHGRGDTTLILNPIPTPQEQFESLDEIHGFENQGLVLEPKEEEVFVIKDLAQRKNNTRISAFCDGTRSTYFVGYEDIYPIHYCENAAVVRTREQSGFHVLFSGMERKQKTLVAPFSRFLPNIRRAYERLGLCSTPLADLCLMPDEERGISPVDFANMGSLAWQSRALRRARRLLDRTEQIVALAGAQMLRELDSSELNWLLKDGAISQFDRAFLKQPETLKNVVACVKTHPVPFFGAVGERTIANMEIGQRSIAFLPRPVDEVKRNVKFAETYRPIISWYLRVTPPDLRNSSKLSGVVRLDIAAFEGWRTCLDDVSWAVLDEFYGLSSMPDPRSDVMPYGIYDCEQFLKAQRLAGNLLLAELN